MNFVPIAFDERIVFFKLCHRNLVSQTLKSWKQSKEMDEKELFYINKSLTPFCYTLFQVLHQLKKKCPSKIQSCQSGNVIANELAQSLHSKNWVLLWDPWPSCGAQHPPGFGDLRPWCVCTVNLFAFIQGYHFAQSLTDFFSSLT